MQTNDLINVINNSSEITKEQLEKIKELIDKFPYFETLYRIYIKGVKINKNDELENVLKNYSIFINDRKSLGEFLFKVPENIIIHQKSTPENIEKTKTEQPKEEKTKVEPETEEPVFKNEPLDDSYFERQTEIHNNIVEDIILTKVQKYINFSCLLNKVNITEEEFENLMEEYIVHPEVEQKPDHKQIIDDRNEKREKRLKEKEEKKKLQEKDENLTQEVIENQKEEIKTPEIEQKQQEIKEEIIPPAIEQKKEETTKTENIVEEKNEVSEKADDIFSKIAKLKNKRLSEKDETKPETKAEEPVKQEIKTKQPVVEEVNVEEPVKEEIIIVEPVKEVVNVEEPIKEEVIIVELVKEEVNVEEPIKEVVNVEELIKEEVNVVEPVKEDVKVVEPVKEEVNVEEPIKEEVKVVEPIEEEVKVTEPNIETEKLSASDIILQKLKTRKNKLTDDKKEEPKKNEISADDVIKKLKEKPTNDISETEKNIDKKYDLIATDTQLLIEPENKNSESVTINEDKLEIKNTEQIISKTEPIELNKADLEKLDEKQEIIIPDVEIPVANDSKKTAADKILDRLNKRKNQQTNLIDSFLENSPTIDRKREPENKEDLSLNGTKDVEVITERLAEIYALQGLTEKAIQTYEKLILKFPEKNTYFAQKIEELKKLNK